MRQIVLSILVENTPGVLSRISGLFTRRGYNIDSITACTTQDQKFSRITIAVSGDDMILKQIKNQLSKLEDVVKILNWKTVSLLQRIDPCKDPCKQDRETGGYHDCRIFSERSCGCI